MKKFLAMLMAVAMVMSLVTIPVLAEDKADSDALTTQPEDPKTSVMDPGEPDLEKTDIPTDMPCFVIDEHEYYNVGDEIAVPVVLYNYEGNAHILNLWVNYDPEALEVTGVENGPFLSNAAGMVLVDWTTVPGSVRAGMVCAIDPTPAGDNPIVIMTVHFTVLEGAQESNELELIVNEFKNFPLNGDVTPIDHTTISGSINLHSEEPITEVPETIAPTVEPTAEPITPEPSDLDAALNAEGGTLHFVSEGAYPWEVYEGGARSTNSNISNSASSVTTTVVANEGDIVQFDFLSLGEGGAGAIWDGLQLYVDGDMVIEWGIVDTAATYAYGLTAGEHTITWTYIKDGSVDNPGDYAWVDNVYVGEPVHPSEVIVEDLSVPAGRRATVRYTVLPVNTFDKSVTFATGDSSIATVDANGRVYGVAEGVTTITVTTVDGGISATATVTVTEALPSVDLIGYIAYDPAGLTDVWGTFADYDPGTITNLNVPETTQTFAATSVGDRIYGYNYYAPDLRFYVIDTDTWTISYPGTSAPVDSIVLGMAYDYTTDTLYAMAGNDMGDERGIYIVDRATGAMTHVADFDINEYGITMATFAIDNLGNAYGIGFEDGMLYSIDLATGECAEIGYTGEELNYVQSMTWDMNTNQLFWAHYSDDAHAYLLKVDPETGACENYGLIGGGAEVLGLCTLNDIEVPDPVLPDITITFVDGVNGDVLGSYVMLAGSEIPGEAFPEPPVHEGLEFTGWDYDGGIVWSDTTVTARYFDPELYAEFVGYIAYDSQGDFEVWGMFDNSNPGTINYIDIPGAVTTFAATSVGDRIYGYNYYGANNMFYVIDTQTWTISYPGASALADSVVFGMAYDYTTDTLYAMAGNDMGEERGIYIVDRASGAMIHVADFDINNYGITMATFAIDNEGNAYGIGFEDGMLYGIDLATGHCEEIGYTGEELNYVQSMTWDMNTNQLFWAHYSDERSAYLLKVDPTDGSCENLGLIGGGAEVLGLCTLNDIEVPDPVYSDITITFVDGVNGDILGSYVMQAGSTIPEEAFPEVPEHEGLEFIGWDYVEGTILYVNTTVTAKYFDPNATGWYFEDDPMDAGWTWEDRDGDGFNWAWMYGEDMNCPEGEGIMNSQSFDNFYGPLTPDNWLISPVFEAGTSVTFLIVGQDPDWAFEPIGVYVSTDGGETWSDEIALFFATGTVETCTVDTSDFAGQDIKIAFRHYDITDMFSVNLDAVEVHGQGGGEPITDEPITGEPITNEPITDEPITDEPITDEPITDEPITEEPITEEPITEEPITDEPVEPTEPPVEPPITGGAAFVGIGIMALLSGAGVVLFRKKED